MRLILTKTRNKTSKSLYNHRHLIAALAVIILVVAGLLAHRQSFFPESKTSSAAKQATSDTPISNSAPANLAEPSQQDLAASLTAVVNKGRILPSDYAPASLAVPKVALRLGSGSPEMFLRTEAATALGQLFAAAAGDGLQLKLASGYRSYSLQNSLYHGYVASLGQSSADSSSARPGHSEHQTGLAADLEPASRNCEIDQCFGNTPEGKWLASNSHKYGFIIRYQSGKEKLTGYEYEPWHVRYLGVDLATRVYQTGKTLEEYFGLATYSDYPASSYQLR